MRTNIFSLTTTTNNKQQTINNNNKQTTNKQQTNNKQLLTTNNNNSDNKKIISSRLIENVNIKYIETVIPRKLGDIVRVVSGKYKSCTGKLIEKDSKRDKATVKVIKNNNDNVHKFYFDDICHLYIEK